MEQGNVNVSAGKLKKNMPTLVILSIAGALIYALPYFRSYYYDSFVLHFGLTNTQMGMLGSVYGGMSMISFFFGGFVADRWKAKSLVIISLISTGLLGFVLLLYPPFPVVFAIHALWGVTAILTFWNALIKVLRSIASSDEQGKVFGFFEGGRGFVNMIQAPIVLALFGVFTSRFNDKVGLSVVITIYSTVCILLGLIVHFVYKEGEDEAAAHEENQKFINVESVKKVMKLPTTWLQILIIFCSYGMIISYFYITPYATAIFGASEVFAAAMGYFSQYCRPIGCFSSGYFADKFGSSTILLISYVIMFLGIMGLIFIDGEPSMIWVLLVFCSAIYTSMYAIQSMHFAIMEEGEYPIEITGTATAIITPLGYSAEFILPMVCGMCLDKWEGIAGYRAIFTILGSMAFIGILSTCIWLKITKPKRMEMKAAREAKAALKKAK